ncbi:MAG: hypothetical protein K6G71_03385 [Clostridiales bacterium]|nr:hypothetical protein [Clostridiales bacterium]
MSKPSSGASIRAYFVSSPGSAGPLGGKSPPAIFGAKSYSTKNARTRTVLSI